ncbi:MAG: AAA family ATPase [Candidatus Solibacter usitatus]|nr:AAA family ATPase [Candidatus Solibacter usitatus]
MPDQTSSDGGEFRPLVFCPERALFAHLTVLWKGIAAGEALECHPYVSQEEALELVGKSTPTMCFLDVGTNRQEALQLLRTLRKASVPVVALHTSNDPELILSCLREGAGEFLCLPTGTEQFHEAIQRITRRARAQNGRGEVLCLMPGKGACGATTIACNLAFQLQAITGEKVLLADLDPLTGTIAFLLKISSEYSFVQALANSSRMDDDLWKGLVVNCRNLDVLLSPESPMDIVQDEQDLAALLQYWRQMYAFVLLDVATPYSDWGLALARLCDSLMMVTTNELPAVLATQNVLAFLDRNGVHRGKVKPIVNRYNADLGLDQEAIEAALDLSVFHVLPSDYVCIQKALLDGHSIPSNTRVGKSITELAERLAGRTPAAPRKPSLLSGLFSRF